MKRLRLESTLRSMRVHVVWSLSELSTSLRSTVALVSYLDPLGERVLYVGRLPGRISVAPGLRVEERQQLFNYVTESQTDIDQLITLVGEIHLPGGHELTDELSTLVSKVISLGEAPPGSTVTESELEVPSELFEVVCQGSAWPGYKSFSVDADGDIVVEHVVTGSLFPAAG